MTTRQQATHTPTVLYCTHLLLYIGPFGKTTWAIEERGERRPDHTVVRNSGICYDTVFMKLRLQNRIIGHEWQFSHSSTSRCLSLFNLHRLLVEQSHLASLSACVGVWSGPRLIELEHELRTHAFSNKQRDTGRASRQDNALYHEIWKAYG